MNKDSGQLENISVYFTEQVLKDIVIKEKNVDRQETIEILSWNFEELSGKGDNYLSVVNRLLIKSIINNTETIETRLIIKSLPNDVHVRKLLRSPEYFRNEIIFYSEIARRFHEYLTLKGQNQLLSIPDCLAYHLDGENDFIALQDVTCIGYGPISRQCCLSYEESKNIVESIAKFHAISFGFKNDKPEEFNLIASFLNETFYRNDIYDTPFKDFYDVLFKIAKDVLNMEYPGTRGEQVFNSYDPADLFRKTVKICSMKDSPSSVISQGDTWAPNFMTRKTKTNNVDVLILDFQIARCSSPVLDLVFFIYECTDKSVRDKYYETLLNNYYDELAKSMRLLDCDPDKLYSWQTFQNEIKEQSLYGLMFALVNIPLSILPEGKSIDFSSINEDQPDLTSFDALTNLEKKEDRQRLADVILHAVDKGFI